MGNLILENGLVNNYMLFLLLKEDGFFESPPKGNIQGAYIKQNGIIKAYINMGCDDSKEEHLVFIKHPDGSYTFDSHILNEYDN